MTIGQRGSKALYRFNQKYSRQSLLWYHDYMHEQDLLIQNKDKEGFNRKIKDQTSGELGKVERKR